MSGQSHRTVACAAIARYDVAPLRVRLAARSFNRTYRVTTASAVYALRVGSALRIHPEGTEAVEAAWHRRLHEQGVHVPGVLANVAGELTTVVADQSGPRVCVLFECAFRAGYAERRPWPDVSPDLFESLVAARWLHQLNITLNVADLGGLDGYVAGHAERIRAWLRRPSGA